MSGAIKAARGGSRAVAQGDPGLFGGLIGGFKGFGGSFLSGGNPFAGAASGAVAGFRGAPSLSTVPPPISVAMGRPPSGRPQGPRGARVIPTPGIVGRIQRFLPGGATGLEMAGAAATGTDMVPFIPKGFHPNKSAYFLRDGTFVAKGSKFVKNRRRNPLNPRALRRAIGRIDAGKIWQGKLHEISTAKFTAAGNRKD